MMELEGKPKPDPSEFKHITDVFERKKAYDRAFSRWYYHNSEKRRNDVKRSAKEHKARRKRIRR